METTAIVMAEPGRLERREVSLPDLGPGDLLMRVEIAGICGTDVHMHQGGMDLDFPVVPGHEFAGELVEVGEDVATDSAGEPVEAGDPVTVVPGIVCEDCWYCDNVPGRPQACRDRDVYGFRNVGREPRAHGGLAEHVVIEDRATFYRLPEGLPLELGALAEPMSVATRAFERGYAPGVPYAREGFGIGKRVAVQGAGPIGLLTAATARAAGAGQVIAVDAIAERLALAEQFGATDTVNLEDHDGEDALVRAVKELTPGGVGPDVVIEAAGVPTAVRQAVELVRDAGTVVEVGHYAYSGEVELNPTRLVQKDVDLRGSLAYPPNQFETALSLLDQRRGEVPFADLFNYRVGFDGVAEAYEKQASGEAYRATIHPGGA